MGELRVNVEAYLDEVQKGNRLQYELNVARDQLQMCNSRVPRILMSLLTTAPGSSAAFGMNEMLPSTSPTHRATITYGGQWLLQRVNVFDRLDVQVLRLLENDVADLLSYAIDHDVNVRFISRTPVQFDTA